MLSGSLEPAEAEHVLQDVEKRTLFFRRIRGNNLKQNLTRPDHPEIFAGDAFLGVGVGLEEMRDALQGVQLTTKGRDAVALLLDLGLEREQVARAVGAALDGESDQAEEDGAGDEALQRWYSDLPGYVAVSPSSSAMRSS